MKIEIFFFVILANFASLVYRPARATTGNSTNLRTIATLIDRFTSQFDYSTIKIVFYNGATRNDNKTYRLADATDILVDPKFDRNKKTVFYCHGYTESPQRKSVQTIVNAYLVRGDHNILVLDWESFAAGSYFTEAKPRAYALGPVVAHTIIRMYEMGLIVANFHIVGHSLGGHLAGVIGEFIYEISEKNYKVKRVTALDPSGPGFNPSILSPINRYVADFVDIIHTDAGTLGLPFSTGSVDFWPNGGQAIQPGCPVVTWQIFTPDNLEFCSHYRSWIYWAESVANSNKTFHAVRAGSYFLYKFGLYLPSPTPAYMGIDANPALIGNYYLHTNAEPPYSRDIEGAQNNGYH